MKKFIILMFAVLSIVGLYTSAQTRNGMVLTDTQAAIDFMYTNGLTMYSTENSFMANNNLRRDEAAAFFARFARDVLGLTPDTSKTECSAFIDLSQGHNDLQGEMIASCQLGLFKGSNGKFMPTSSFTNAQALTVIVRLLNGEKEEPSDAHWAREYRSSAVYLGMTESLQAGKYENLDKYISRGDVAKLIEAGSKYKEELIEMGESIDDTMNCNENSPPSITLLSPNGGETRGIGQTHPVQWSTCNAPDDSWVWLTYTIPENAVNITQGGDTIECFGGQISALQGSYNWTISDTLRGCSDAGFGFNANTSFQTKINIKLYTGTPSCTGFPAPNSPCLTETRTLHAESESNTTFTINQ